MVEHILVVEDDTTIRLTLRDVLGKQGYQVELAEDGATGLERFRAHSYALVMLDLRLPDMHGLEVLRAMRESDPEALVVVMTAYPEVRTAVDCVKAGAYDYFNKPFELDDLKEVVRRALETRRLRLEVERLRVAAPQARPVEGMIGSSPAFLAMVEVTRRIAAAARVPVLIRGESGTGKERIAQAIHNLSPRAGGPWVTLNCSALAEGLLESEMFGHERGAFTDAKTAKRGLLELADGGTLFLDEIGDLSLGLQPKLLRALETQAFRRVGGQKELHVDVRFVAATHRDLEAMVKAGSFREDLYYRLNVGSIEVPALRSRRADVLPLARHFLAEAGTMMGMHAPRLEPEVAPLLEQYAWPGNVRELRNVMERALILSGGAPVAPVHLPREVVAATARREATHEETHGRSEVSSSPSGGLARSGRSGGAHDRDPDPDGTSVLPLAEIEKRHIRRALEHCRGNKTRAAKLLGITRLTLRTKITAYGWHDYLEVPET